MNKTVITIENGKLFIKIKPLFWIGNNELDTSKINQLYVEEYVPFTTNKVPQKKYRIKIIYEGYPLNIVGSIKKYENARMIERLIEQKLGIKDTMVDGKVP